MPNKVDQLFRAQLFHDRVLRSPLVIIGKTHSETATMIDSNIDPIDQPHILADAIRNGTDQDWEKRAGSMTFPDLIAGILRSKGVDASDWLKASLKMSSEVRAAIPHQMLSYNLSPSFNWDTAGMTDCLLYTSDAADE